MAWTQTLARWKSNPTPPCSGPLVANVTCCSLAAVFFSSLYVSPGMLGKLFLDIFMEMRLRLGGAGEDALFLNYQADQEQPKIDSGPMFSGK